ncbi:MAG: response regulator, partial [Acidobacteria bacterium]|nr:response regulator [Acidobacteriota bacterium]
ELTSTIVGREGFRVETASSGPEALDKARFFMPDVITLDVMMPGMDGWTVLANLKQHPVLSKIPVIMLTIVDDRKLGYALGAADFVLKPVERERLANALRKYGVESRPGRVLVVDDDEAIRSMMRSMLDREGWQVAEAENGKGALARVKEAVPDVILLDLLMPEMDGFELVEMLKKDEASRNVPIVVLTSLSLSEEERERLNGSVDRVLEKSAQSFAELEREIRTFVKAHAGPKEPKEPKEPAA